MAGLVFLLLKFHSFSSIFAFPFRLVESAESAPSFVSVALVLWDAKRREREDLKRSGYRTRSEREKRAKAEVSFSFGSRHRGGMGISETAAAACLPDGRHAKQPVDCLIPVARAGSSFCSRSPHTFVRDTSLSSCLLVVSLLVLRRVFGYLRKVYYPPLSKPQWFAPSFCFHMVIDVIMPNDDTCGHFRTSTRVSVFVVLNASPSEPTHGKHHRTLVVDVAMPPIYL